MSTTKYIHMQYINTVHSFIWETENINYSKLFMFGMQKVNYNLNILPKRLQTYVLGTLTSSCNYELSVV
jgi:hypothetical protein